MRNSVSKKDPHNRMTQQPQKKNQSEVEDFLPRSTVQGKKLNVNLFQYVKTQDFKLVSMVKRSELLDDLYEYDKCFYINYFKVNIEQKEEPQKKTFFSQFKRKKTQKEINEIWRNIVQQINTNKNVDLYNEIQITLKDKGIPDMYRATIWKYLIGNKIKINKELFYSLYKSILKKCEKDVQIKKDLERTYRYFHGQLDFKYILLESSILLEMFQIYRPDIKYIQGMSYVMVMLLLHYEPIDAFKLFCNLILQRKFLYNTYLFKLKYIQNINVCFEYLISKNYYELYSYLKDKQIDLWNILWIEWIYAMFLRTFDFRTCQILWDLILVKGDLFVFKLTYVIFGMINEAFHRLDKNQLFDSIRKLLLGNSKKLLKKLSDQQNHEFEFIFLENLLHNYKLS